MPYIDTEFAGYRPDTGYVYIDSSGEYTAFDTEFVPDWRVDEDPRKVATYVECLSDRYLDRSNDEYLEDKEVRFGCVLRDSEGKVTGHIKPHVSGVADAKPEPVRSILHGFDVTKGEDVTVWCWYCNTHFSYSEFVSLAPQAYDQERMERAFCYAMLEHYDEHKDAEHLPYIKYAGRTIYRPDGSVAAEKPGFVGRPPAKMQGPAASWFDPTAR